MIGAALLLLLAVGLEGLAAGSFSGGETPLAALGVAHGVATALAAIGAARAVRGAGAGDPRAQALGVVAGALSFFAPPFGVAAAAAIALGSVRRGRSRTLDALERDLAPDPTLRTDGARIRRTGDLESLVDDFRFGEVARRRAAVERLRDIGGRESIAALRNALRDGDGEVRSLAQQALAAVEERLSRDILAARDEVRRAPDEAAPHAALANQYAEYCYLGVLDDVTRRYYLELAVKGYARALEIGRGEGADAGDTLLAIGKALLALGRTKLASTFFERAAAAAPHDARPVLWRAEAFFRQGNLARVREECARAASLGPHDPRVKLAAEYWAGTSLAAPPAAAAPAPPAEAESSTEEEAPPTLTLAEEMRGLAAALGSPDPQARATAFHRLLAFESDAAVEALSDAIDEAPEGVHVLYCRYLARLAPRGGTAVLDRLARLLDSRTDPIRREASLALDAAPDGTAKTDALVWALTHGYGFARIFAAQTLARVGAERSVPALIEALADRTVEVREAALQALRRFRSPRAVPEIAALARDPSPEIRCRALVTLGELGPRLGAGVARRAARRCLEDPSGRVRQAAVWAVARLGGRGAAAAIARSLGDQDDEFVRLEAARRLGRCAARSDAPVRALLRTYASDGSRVVRRAARFALDEVPVGTRLPALLEALVGDDAALRYAAAVKLGDSRDGRAVLPLAARLARDGVAAVRAGAAESLGRLRDAGAAGPLETALRDESEAVVYSAAVALGALDARAGLDAVARRLEIEAPALVEQSLLRAVEELAAANPDLPLPELVFAFALRRLASETANVRYAAALALAKAGRAEALEPLLDLAEKEPMREIARAAANAAGEILHGDPRPLLSRLAREDVAGGRAAALVAGLGSMRIAPERWDEAARRLLGLAPGLRRSGRLAGPRADRDLLAFFRREPGRLIRFVEDERDPTVAAEALRAIAGLAPSTDPAEVAIAPREAILKALARDDARVRAAAAAAIGALRIEEATPRLVDLALGPDAPVAAAAAEAVRRLCAPERAREAASA